jgi:hypothetical protein
MKATADSNVKSNICVKIKEKRIKLEAKAVWLPSKVIKRWPATILAIKRTASVKGRMMFLMDSMRTINGMRRLGVL